MSRSLVLVFVLHVESLDFFPVWPFAIVCQTAVDGDVWPKGNGRGPKSQPWEGSGVQNKNAEAVIQMIFGHSL